MGTGTELGRVRGLGSGHHGVQHWWHQRLTAGFNVFAMLWLLLAVGRLPAYDWAGVHEWLRSGWVAIPMAMLIASVFYHFRLGLQVLIEDYSHAESRVVLLVLLNAFTAVVTAVALFSIAKVALGSAA